MALYGMTGILAQNKIDMRALSVAETREFGILRIIVDDLYKTATVLKDAGYVHNLTPVLGGGHPRRAGRTEQGPSGPHRRPGSMWSICTPSWGARSKPAYMIFPAGGGGGAAARPGRGGPPHRRGGREGTREGGWGVPPKNHKNKETAPVSTGAVRFFTMAVRK